jgi:predicted RNase H-like HicB family nuclease
MTDLRIEKLPEGVYLATSNEVPGLVVQGRTETEVIETSHDVERRLSEARAERDEKAVPRRPSGPHRPRRRPENLKEILESAPLEGVDLTRRKELPRAIDP